MSHAVFPDAEAVVITVLRAAEFPVASALPANPTYPLLVVKRIGGLPAEKHHTDNPSLQIEAWGSDKAQVQDLAQAARAAIHDAEGSTIGELSAFITGVEDTLGLSWSPDPVSQRARFVFGVGLYLTRLPD